MNIQDYLRARMKVEKPEYLSLEEWDNWENKLKTSRPWAYFVTEEIWDKINDITYPIRNGYMDCKNYIRHRLFDRYHMVDTGLKPGYYDTSDRILHSCFSLLKDYVEIELSWKTMVFDESAKKKYSLPFFSNGLFRIKNYRNRDAGLDHLRWEKGLTNDESMGYKPSDSIYGTLTDQAIRAKEIEELYLWWTQIRPLRQDSMDESGWSAYCEKMKHLKKDGFWINSMQLTDEEQQEQKNILQKVNDLDNQHMKEDEEMLIRLVKIREGLWT